MAMKKVIYLYIAIALAGLLLISCSERTNPADFPKINTRAAGSDGVYWYPRAFQSTIADHVNFDRWKDTYGSPEYSFPIKVYTPPDYEDYGTPRPILYLLHDFNGNHNYYFNRMIHRIADSLIYEDEIEQFFIATVDVSSPYGGTWYTNNEFCGHVEDMVTEQLIEWLEVEVPQLKIIQKRDSRAIGGFGMGGYGALKLAAKHPDLYSAVSTSNAAGMFVGTDGFRGIDDLINLVFEEQGFSASITEAEFLTGFDTTSMFNEKPYTLLFFSMAQAFSPHPFEGEAGFEDSTTFLEDYWIDLPFGYNRTLYQPVWEKWLDNTVDIVLTANADHFDSIALYMEYSDIEQFYFNEQAQAIMELCDNLGISYESDNYSGYEGYEASNQHFIYDRLVKILKFHSDQFDYDL